MKLRIGRRDDETKFFELIEEEDDIVLQDEDGCNIACLANTDEGIVLRLYGGLPPAYCINSEEEIIVQSEDIDSGDWVPLNADKPSRKR